MASIHDFYEVKTLSETRDYSLLIDDDGFVVPSETSLIASISTHCAAAYISLLEFEPGVPRGNQHHLIKVEYMTVLRGRLFCELELVDDPEATTELELSTGQMIVVQPRCIHTYTALERTAIALEFSPEAYDPADTIYKS